MVRTADDVRIDQLIGTRIQERRRQLQKTQEELAVAAGVSPSLIQRCEVGASGVSAATLYKIAEVLGVKVTYFFPPAVY